MSIESGNTPGAFTKGANTGNSPPSLGFHLTVRQLRDYVLKELTPEENMFIKNHLEHDWVARLVCEGLTAFLEDHGPEELKAWVHSDPEIFEAEFNLLVKGSKTKQVKRKDVPIRIKIRKMVLSPLHFLQRKTILIAFFQKLKSMSS
ncbi:MAG: hypothetical protein AAF587_08930 [Bacteroidota bacterium]